MSEPAIYRTDDTDIVQALIKKVIADPVEGEKIAREFGLWDIVRTTLLKPLRIKMAREDVNAFIEYVIEDPETGQLAQQMGFHREWQRLISTLKRVMIVAPRGHGKSIQVIARVIWEIGRNHNIRVKIVSSKDEKAKEILGTVRDMIKKDPRVKEIFPDLEVDEDRGDTKSEFFVKRSNISMRDATVQAAGVLSAGAGGRADILLCDDVVDPKNALINPSQREQVKTVLKSTWFSLVAATGKIIYLATPYHVLDATHDLKESAGSVWTVWWTPAEKIILHFGPDGEPVLIPDPEQNGKMVQEYHKEYLWPEKWNAETLAAKRFELGPKVYAAQYLLNAMSDEDRTFPETSLQKSYNRSLSYIGEDIEDDWPTFGGIDLASALGKRAAFTVLFTLARNPVNGKYRIKEIVRRKMGFTKTMEHVAEQFRRHKWRMAFVENNQYQRAVIDAAEDKLKHIPVQGFHTSGSGKADEEIGLPGLNVAFDRGLFELPAARFPLEADDQTDLGILMTELQTHPGGETKDVVMAMWFAYRAAIEGASGAFEDAYLAAIALA